MKIMPLRELRAHRGLQRAELLGADIHDLLLHLQHAAYEQERCA